MASFGSLVVGERRSGWDRPARSAILGLVGACMGIDRQDEAAHSALTQGYDLALLCVAPGDLLADYQTAEVPSASSGDRFATRAEELGQPKAKMNTVLSRRDYRVGAWHLASLSPRGAPRWELTEFARAMQSPAFVTYLGRKSCPLGLPLAPEIVDAADATSALLHRHQTGPEAFIRQRWLSQSDREADENLSIAMDSGLASLGDNRRQRIETRRDTLRSRRRWQFGLRNELILKV